MFLQMQRDVAVGNKSDLGGGGGGGGRRRMGKRRKGGRAIEKKAPRSFAYGGGRQVGWAVVEGEGDKTKGFFKREEKERDCALFELVPANSIYVGVERFQIFRFRFGSVPNFSVPVRFGSEILGAGSVRFQYCKTKNIKSLLLHGKRT